jgi:hypothetical protein
MTVLADAAAIYVGDVAAVAVYQGTRRVWPAWTGTAATGAFLASDNSVHITVAATRAALQVPSVPILVTLDQASRDWAATHPTTSAIWWSSDGQPLYVMAPGAGVDYIDLGDLAANEAAPTELRWRRLSEFDLVFNP